MIGRFPLNLVDPIQYVSGFSSPFGIAYDATGGRIAVVQSHISVVILDASTLSILTTVTIAGSVGIVEFDSANNRFLVSDDDSGQVWAISGIDYSVTSYIASLGNTAVCRAIRISDTRVFFSCFFGGTTSSKIFVYDLSTATLITSFFVNNACGMDIADGKIWASCHNTNNVKVYDLTTYALITTISVGVDCYTITNDPDLGYMIIQSRDNNQLKLLRRSDSTIVGGFAGVTGPNCSIFKGNEIYVTLPSNKLAIIDKFYS